MNAPCARKRGGPSSYKMKWPQWALEQRAPWLPVCHLPGTPRCREFVGGETVQGDALPLCRVSECGCFDSSQIRHNLRIILKCKLQKRAERWFSLRESILDNSFMPNIFMKSVYSSTIRVYAKEIYLDFFCASTSYETNKRSLFTKVLKNETEEEIFSTILDNGKMKPI